MHLQFSGYCNFRRTFDCFRFTVSIFMLFRLSTVSLVHKIRSKVFLFWIQNRLGTTKRFILSEMCTQTNRLFQSSVFQLFGRSRRFIYFFFISMLTFTFKWNTHLINVIKCQYDFMLIYIFANRISIISIISLMKSIIIQCIIYFSECA